MISKLRTAVSGNRPRQALQRITHKGRLPRLSVFDQGIVDGLERNAFYVTSLDALAAAGILAPTLLDRAGLLVEETRQVTTDQYVVHGSQSTLTGAAKDIPLWGLTERFLDIAEAYIGLPVNYRGVAMRRDIANGEQTGTRFWHVDGEDSRIMKIIVYLNDVGPDGGPFTCIPKSLSKGMEFPTFEGSRIPDEAIDARIPNAGTTCTGPRGTVAFADPCSAIHRGAVPEAGDRYTLFFAYNSKIPLAPQYCQPLHDFEALTKNRTLSLRQRSAVQLAF